MKRFAIIGLILLLTSPAFASAGGTGADLILWQSEEYGALVEEVSTEYRYDTIGDDHIVYGVVRLNLWQKFAKKFFKKEVKGMYILGSGE